MKRKQAHGNPKPYRTITPPTHDRWMGQPERVKGAGGAGRWTASCGCRFDDYHEHLEHKHVE